MKAFTWYREAKIVLKDIQDELKALIARIRVSKLKFSSLNFEHFFTNLLFVGALIGFLFIPHLEQWRNGAVSPLFDTVLLGLFGVLGLSTFIINMIYTKYKTYPFHLGSTVRRQIVGQRVMINDLEKKSVKLEQTLAKKAKQPRKLRIPLENVSIIRKYSRKTNAELLDYVYAENDYFYQKYSGLLGFMHFVFVVAILCAAAMSAILIVL